MDDDVKDAINKLRLGEDAIQGVVSLGATVVEPLTQALKERRESLSRKNAVRALAEIADPKTEQTLTQILGRNTEDPRVRVWAAYGLARLGDEKAKTLLQKFLDVRFYWANGIAASSVAGTDLREAEPVILGERHQILDYPGGINAAVRDEAARALRLLGTPEAEIRKAKARKYRDIIKELEDQVKKNPKDAIAHYVLGIKLLEQANIDEAVPPLKKAVDLNPNFMLAYYALGDAYSYRRGTYFREMVGAYKRAVALDPRNNDALEFLEMALAAGKEIEDAVQYAKIKAR